MLQILVFGDSIAYGLWDKEGGWVGRLRKFLDEKSQKQPTFYCPVYNLSIDGDTSGDLLGRFEFEIKPRLKEEKTIIIIAIGINDSIYFHHQKDNQISKRKFKENLKKLITLSHKISNKTILLGLTTIDETKVDPIPWLPNTSYKNEQIKRYNEIVKSVSKLKEAYFIEVFEKWIKLDFKDLLEDGVHPNSKGHEILFETVRDFLLEKEIIS